MSSKIKYRGFQVELKNILSAENIRIKIQGLDVLISPTGFAEQADYLFVIVSSELFKLFFHLGLISSDKYENLRNTLIKKLSKNSFEKTPYDVCYESLTKLISESEKSNYFKRGTRININDHCQEHDVLFSEVTLNFRYVIKFNDFKQSKLFSLYALAIESNFELNSISHETPKFIIHNFDKKH